MIIHSSHNDGRIDGTRFVVALIVCVVALACASCVPVGPGDQDPCPRGAAGGATTVNFSDDVLPLLAAKGCLTSGCHGTTLPSSDFVLTDYDAAFTRGETARALELCPIVPSEPDASWIIEKLRPEPRSGERMPFRRPALTDEEIEVIATWIREGAANN